ncbi:pilus assembly protein PilQ [Sorangium cellulosum]|uniref:Pilus assembly protein PilQ n=3 Tax=Sorangium cellulosum TaxID=56 RepID=A0A150U2F0_SORCE|nr:pilus assembly protein PilQ [Sorangium cellulosum]
MKSNRDYRPRRGALRRAAALGMMLILAPAGDADAAAPIRVSDVRLTAPSEDRAEIVVATSGAPRFSARVADGGKRILVDLEGAEAAGAPGAITDGNAIVAGVMTQGFGAAAQRTTRVLVQLARPAAYRIRAEQGALVIELAAADATAPMTARAPASREAAAPAREPATITDVRFEHQATVDRVIIELSSIPSYRESTGRAGRRVIELSGARLPDALQRKLDVGAFGGPVRAISAFRRNSDGSKVVVEVEQAEGAAGALAREGNALVLSVAKGALPSTLSGIGADGGAARRTRTVAREDLLGDAAPRVETSFEGADGGVGAEPGFAGRSPHHQESSQESLVEPDQAGAFTPALAGQQRRFTGRRIDLDLKDADIHNVLRLISDVGRVNIVTADNVSGTVTIRMRNVPWDQALETVLQAKGLGVVRQGNMIRVAPIADLNKERELAIARRKSELQLAPIETRLIPINYADAKDLQDRAKDMLSPRGSLAVDERTNVLIARDVAGNLNQIEELVRSLDTQTPQVLIEARVVEATSRYVRDIGIQWGGDGTFSAATGNPTGLVFPSAIGLAGGATDTNTPTGGLSPFSNTVSNPNFAVNLPAVVGAGQGGALGFTLGSINNTVNLGVRLSAAEASGMLRIISSPRILTLDNREARISQGTLIPFSQISAQGVQTTFQEAKLQLLVKPHVTSDGSVAMHVKINRDEPDFNQTSARGDPTILKREAETDLLIMDGHTAVIGGIFTRNTGRNLDQVPFFGDIPVLGLLFQRRRASDTRSELVIFLTPRIVNRAEALGR